MADLGIYNLSKNQPGIFESFAKGREMRQNRLLKEQAIEQNICTFLY